MPDLKRKLEILADAAKYGASCASSGAQARHSLNGIEIEACHRWLEAESTWYSRRRSSPSAPSAARSVLRREVRVNACRGRSFVLRAGRSAIVTMHPSYLLRLAEDAARATEYERLVADLAQVSALAPL